MGPLHALEVGAGAAGVVQPAAAVGLELREELLLAADAAELHVGLEVVGHGAILPHAAVV
ncbi:hypothetical protein D3C72_2474290 [compost metagenome]